MSQRLFLVALLLAVLSFVALPSVVEAACGPGQYNVNGQCTPCPAGTAKNYYGGGECPPCDLGTYQPSTGQTTCLQCPPSTYQDSTGAIACVACPSGQWSPSGSYACDTIRDFVYPSCAEEQTGVMNVFAADAAFNAAAELDGSECPFSASSTLAGRRNHSLRARAGAELGRARYNQSAIWGYVDASFSDWNQKTAADNTRTRAIDYIAKIAFKQYGWLDWFTLNQQEPLIANGPCMTNPPPAAMILQDVNAITLALAPARQVFSTDRSLTREEPVVKLIDIYVTQIITHYIDAANFPFHSMTSFSELWLAATNARVDVSQLLAMANQCFNYAGNRQRVNLEYRFRDSPYAQSESAPSNPLLPSQASGSVEFVFIAPEGVLNNPPSPTAARATRPIAGVIEAKSTNQLAYSRRPGNDHQRGEPQIILELAASYIRNLQNGPNVAGSNWEEAPVYGALTDGRYWKFYAINRENPGGVLPDDDNVQGFGTDYLCFYAYYQIEWTGGINGGNQEWYDWQIPGDAQTVVEILHGMIKRGYYNSNPNECVAQPVPH